MLGELVWDLKGEEGNSHGDEKTTIWERNVYWADRQWDAEWTLLSAEFPQHTWLTFFARVPGEGSIPGTEPLSKFFQAVKEKIKVSS